MDKDIRKVVELICGAIPPIPEKIEDPFVSITLTEEDFGRQGISIDLGSHILKHKLDTHGVFDVCEIYISNPEDTMDERLWGKYCISFETHLGISSLLEDNLSNNNNAITFSFNNCMLTINGKDISFGSIGKKQNGCYILEHLFSKKDTKYSAYYWEIQEDNPIDEYNEDWRVLYRACVTMQTKIGKEVGIGDFILYEASPDGSVRINPKYL